MEAINPAVKDSLVRLSHSMARDYPYLESQVDRVEESVITFRTEMVEIDRAAFTDLAPAIQHQDRKSTRLNSSHALISYAVFCLKKKTTSQEAVKNPLLIEDAEFT